MASNDNVIRHLGRRDVVYQIPDDIEDADIPLNSGSRINTVDGERLTPGEAATQFELTMSEDWMNGVDSILQIMEEDMVEVQPRVFDTTPYTGALDPDLDPEAYTTQQVFEDRWNALEAKVDRMMKMIEELSTVGKIENMTL